MKKTDQESFVNEHEIIFWFFLVRMIEVVNGIVEKIVNLLKNKEKVDPH